MIIEPKEVKLHKMKTVNLGFGIFLCEETYSSGRPHLHPRNNWTNSD